MRQLAGELGMPPHWLTSWGRLCWCAIGEDHDDDAFAVDEDDMGDIDRDWPWPSWV